MKITILGTGMVGMTIAERLIELGHQITMGTRNPEATRTRNTSAQWGKIPFGQWLDGQKGIHLSTYDAAA